MLRKSWIALICICILLTSCGTKTSIENTDIPETKEEDNSELRVAWSEASDYENIEVHYEIQKYLQNVPQYEVKNDLSNLENIDRFSGFTEKQKEMLSKNGFVVLKPKRENAFMYMKMYNIYEDNEYKQIPSFVTSDIAMHLYHKFYSETLKFAEKEYLYTELQLLTDRMLKKILIIHDNKTYEKVVKDLESILIYFSVANKLLNDTYGGVPDDVKKVAKAEINLIQNAEGYYKSPLLGRDVNYEQFIVRGHYAEDESLEKYFKTMMWYGLLGFPLEEKDDLKIDSTIKAMLITYVTFLEYEGSNDIESWDKIYAPTDFYVGQSDDITIFQMRDMILNVYGQTPNINDFRDEKYYGKMYEEVKKLPAPQIRPKLVTVDTPAEKQFRFMGQRYTLDSNILQELMFPIIRPVPSGLDVAAALGNERAEALAYKYFVGQEAVGIYRASLTDMKNKVKNTPGTTWMSNLYNGWLWNIKGVLQGNTEKKGIPPFMQTQAWEDKSIQTALGSYAELKHDTVLYVKQPVAEMGGGVEPQYVPQYVEPNVELYNKLIWLVQYSSENLLVRGLMNETKANAAEHLLSFYILLRDCSIKELANEPLTEEENRRLMYIGGAMDNIDNSLSTDYNKMLSSALVTDIAGIADANAFLEIGTEFPNEIYVAIYEKGKIYLARGAVYGYHEFLSDKPLTDQQWHETLGIERIKVNGGEYEFEQISKDKFLKDVPPQPEWIYSFKSNEENTLKISEIEFMAE